MMHLLVTGILALGTPPVQPPPPAPQEAVASVEPVRIPSSSFRQHVQDGQLAMEQGRWEDAAAAFESAQSMLDVPLAELTYNKAVADYRRGEYQLASEGFTNAIAQGTSPELHRDAAYNLGNSAHSRVVESLQSGNAQDAQGAIDQLSKAQEELGGALEHYRQAIRSDSEDADARANAELTWNLIEQLRDMEEQLEEQQQQQDQQQDQQQGNNSSRINNNNRIRINNNRISKISSSRSSSRTSNRISSSINSRVNSSRINRISNKISSSSSSNNNRSRSRSRSSRDNLDHSGRATEGCA